MSSHLPPHELWQWHPAQWFAEETSWQALLLAHVTGCVSSKRQIHMGKRRWRQAWWKWQGFHLCVNKCGHRSPLIEVALIWECSHYFIQRTIKWKVNPLPEAGPVSSLGGLTLLHPRTLTQILFSFVCFCSLWLLSCADFPNYFHDQVGCEARGEWLALLLDHCPLLFHSHKQTNNPFNWPQHEIPTVLHVKAELLFLKPCQKIKIILHEISSGPPRAVMCA